MKSPVLLKVFKDSEFVIFVVVFLQSKQKGPIKERDPLFESASVVKAIGLRCSGEYIDRGLWGLDSELYGLSEVHIPWDEADLLVGIRGEKLEHFKKKRLVTEVFDEGKLDLIGK